MNIRALLVDILNNADERDFLSKPAIIRILKRDEHGCTVGYKNVLIDYYHTISKDGPSICINEADIPKEWIPFT